MDGHRSSNKPGNLFFMARNMQGPKNRYPVQQTASAHSCIHQVNGIYPAGLFLIYGAGNGKCTLFYYSFREVNFIFCKSVSLLGAFGVSFSFLKNLNVEGVYILVSRNCIFHLRLLLCIIFSLRLTTCLQFSSESLHEPIPHLLYYSTKKYDL